MRDKEFSSKIFSQSGLYGDKPDFNKVQEMLEDYEYQYLSSLNWF